MPFALTNEQITEAIEIFKKGESTHFDAHCPKCRHTTKVSKEIFELNPVYKNMMKG